MPKCTYGRNKHQSGTFRAEPGTCLEHCLDSYNAYTNYSTRHPISVDPIPLLPTVTFHFRLNFDYFSPEPFPSPHLPNVINELPLTIIKIVIIVVCVQT